MSISGFFMLIGLVLLLVYICRNVFPKCGIHQCNRIALRRDKVEFRHYNNSNIVVLVRVCYRCFDKLDIRG